MSQNTKIQWCDYTWNPVWGCLGGCSYCYARGIAKRFGKQMAKFDTKYMQKNDMKGVSEQFKAKELIEFVPTALNYRFAVDFPKNAKRIFVNSMSDIAFWDTHWVLMVIEKIKENPDKVFMILTKFPEKLKSFEFPSNVWLGLTVTNQKELDEKFMDFLDIRWKFDSFKAGKRFLSIEPMLSEIDLYKRWPQLALRYYTINSFDWIIVGGQNGHNSIPMKQEWVDSIIDQCEENDKPFFFKGWGQWIPKCGFCPREKSKEFFGETYFKKSKNLLGHTIDGQYYREFPK